MRILFLVARPTQFEAPFFRFAALDREHELKPLFWDARAAAPAEDRELGRTVDWGFDLLSGYPHAIATSEGGTAWIERELDEGCDLLIVNGYTLAPCRFAAGAARCRGIATALRLDSVRFPGDPPPSLARRLLVRRVLGRWFDRFLGTSSLTLDYLARCQVRSSRCGLFPYAVDHEHFRAESTKAAAHRSPLREAWGVPAGARVVLAIAKLHARETPRGLLEAVRHLPPNVHLVLAGDGPERAAIEALAREVAFRRIHLLGYVPYRRLPELYAAADLFVHVPPEERWGVSVAEALASGLPVVAGSRVGAGYDLIQQGENGFITDGRAPRALAGTIEGALVLESRTVTTASAVTLARWDYAASWRSLLAAARANAG